MRKNLKTVEQLKAIVREYKRVHCKPYAYSRKSKRELTEMVEELSVLEARSAVAVVRPKVAPKVRSKVRSVRRIKPVFVQALPNALPSASAHVAPSMQRIVDDKYASSQAKRVARSAIDVEKRAKERGDVDLFPELGF